MKKITAMLVFAATVFMAGTACADDDRPITVGELPAPAQQFIKKYFAEATVSYATVDKGMMDTSYDVVFADGRKVEFDKKGEWKDIGCKPAAVPADAVPMAIRNYVEKNYPGQMIVKIDRDKWDFELELQNGLDLKFDKSFKLIGIDD